MTTTAERPIPAPPPPPPPPDAGGPERPVIREPLPRRIVRALSHGPLHVVLIVIALAWLTPTLGLFVSSLRSVTENSESGWWRALTDWRTLSLENYRSILDNDRIVEALRNTVLITVPATLGVVFIASLAAYAFAWIDFKGRDWYFVAVVALLVVPIQVALIPVASLYGDLGIYGDLSGVVLFHIAFGLPFAVFLLRNFFAGIPRELLEAARIDGAGEFKVFRMVVLPIGLPAIASLAIFQFLWTWNDLLVGLVFADETNAPITVAIRNQTRQFGTNIDIIAPAAFLSMIVPLLVFFAFQRYFVQGLLAGSER
ncbi:MAG: carbohydrate ABC transporter permease [Acidimicrobiia bacterium]